MRKTVEIEYVGIEDMQEISDDAYAAMREGHYVSISFCNTSKPFVLVSIIVNGYESGKDIDYTFGFRFSDKEEDVKEMNACKSVLKNLLVEE